MGRDFETLQLHPTLATRLYSVLRDLKELGHNPVLTTGWRTQSEQAQLKAKGRSRVPWSFHQYLAGKTPASMAVHVTDKNMWPKGKYVAPQNKNNKFWVDLEKSANRHGLYTGRQWKDPFDPAHVQLYDNSLRKYVAAGKNIPFAGGMRIESDLIERDPWRSATGLSRKLRTNLEMEIEVRSAMRDKRPVKLKIDTSLASGVDRIRQTAGPINWVDTVGATFAEPSRFDVHLDRSLGFRLNALAHTPIKLQTTPSLVDSLALRRPMW